MNHHHKHAKRSSLYLVLLVAFVSAIRSAAASPPREIALTEAAERYVAIDNVCAWPNLTMMRDGTIIAAIFNRPSHGREEGSIEAWASTDGRFWEKRGVVAPNDPMTNRMNVAAGLANNGDLVAIVGGWTNVQQPGRPKQLPFRDGILPLWVCRSSDGGRTWTQRKEFPPENKAWFLPYGNIAIGADGALHASAYESMHREEQIGAGIPLRRGSFHFRSDDDGKTWRTTSVIASGLVHNETSLLHLGGGNWIAAVRNEESKSVELFRSNDDGETWKDPQPVTEAQQLPADLLRLGNGRLLVTYGNRVNGQLGVMAKLSHDEGHTWSLPIRLAWTGPDNGYPSSVQRADGKIVTAYYASTVDNHNRYHMGVVIWDPIAGASNDRSDSAVVTPRP